MRLEAKIETKESLPLKVYLFTLISRKLLVMTLFYVKQKNEKKVPDLNRTLAAY